MAEKLICSVCRSRKATKLCDGRKYPKDPDRWEETCDAPLCGNCTQQRGGLIFMCSRAKGLKVETTDEMGLPSETVLPSRLKIETIDYCPACWLRLKGYSPTRLKWNK